MYCFGVCLGYSDVLKRRHRGMFLGTEKRYLCFPLWTSLMETNLRIIHDSETSESIHYSKWLFIQSIRDIHCMRRGKFCGYNLFEIAMGLVTGGVKIGLVS